MRKINLVTGATGFLGSHVVKELVDKNEIVRVFVRKTSDLSFLKQFDIEIAYGCLSDRESVVQASKGVDTIFHCAAYVSDYGPYEHFETANVTGVKNVLDSCLSNRIKRLIYISTTDVYGYPKSSVDESAPFKKKGFSYGNTKIEGEKLVWEYYDKYKIPVTVFRPATIYGERTPFLNEILAMLEKRTYLHIGCGEVDAGLIHVSNLVDAMILAQREPKSIGQAYNIIDGNHVSFRTLSGTLADISGFKNPRFFIPFPLAYILGFSCEKLYALFPRKGRPFVTRMAACLFGISQDFSIDKIQEELHWKPLVSFEEGMEQIRESLEG